MEVKISCTREEKELFIGLLVSDEVCPFGYSNENGKDCTVDADCKRCLNNRIKWTIKKVPNKNTSQPKH